MLRVTDRALDVPEQLRDATDARPDDAVLRFREDTGNVEHAGRAIVIVSEELDGELDGLVRDDAAMDDGTGFMLARV